MGCCPIDEGVAGRGPMGQGEAGVSGYGCLSARWVAISMSKKFKPISALAEATAGREASAASWKTACTGRTEYSGAAAASGRRPRQ